MIAMKWYALNQIEATAMTLQPRKRKEKRKDRLLFTLLQFYHITNLQSVQWCSKVLFGVIRCYQVLFGVIKCPLFRREHNLAQFYKCNAMNSFNIIRRIIDDVRNFVHAVCVEIILELDIM